VLGWDKSGGAYENRPALLLRVNIELKDGKKVGISSGPGWKATSGAVVFSNIYHGETYDARLEPQGWLKPAFDDSGWQPATIYKKKTRKLVVQPCQPIRVTQEIRPVSIREISPGVFLYDMGQNMVGWARLKVHGPAGTRVQMRFIEVLNPDGSVYVTNLRKARQTDVYILNGQGEEIYEPRFTYHGFRYVEVSGYPGVPGLDDLTGRVFHTDLPAVGDFSCSSPEVNRLVENIRWGQRGNFMAVPTDCPQRDERLGWTGDANLFARTATYNMDCAAYFTKWMVDLRNGQSRNGAYPDVAPKIVVMKEGAPAWGDIAVGLPWVIYQVYGDKRLIDEYYPSMRRWMEYIHSENLNYLRKNRLNNNYGDWVPMDPNTPKDLLATAFWAFDAKAMAGMADAIGKHEDAESYRVLYEEIRKAFQEEYTKDSNILRDWFIRGQTQTGYALALVWDLLPEDQRPLAVARLVSDIYRRGVHLSTGFVGTAFLLPALSDHGYNDLAYQLLLQDTFPSWIYPIRQGATTIWERWDSYTDHLGFQSPVMNSFNHFALGTVGEWLFRYAAGIDTSPDGAGYKKILLHPRPGKELEWVKASYDSIRGTIGSHWKRLMTGIELEISVPPNTTAEVYLPGADKAREAEGAAFLRNEKGCAVYSVGSGNYLFRW
jgi:alpha-L-rhamnosidase